MNDLCVLIDSEIIFYADDLKLYRTITDYEDCVSLQQDLDKLMIWCRVNAMEMNLGKCKILTFSRSRTEITHSYLAGDFVLEKVESMRDLGVILDKSLTFEDHLALTVAKAKTVLGFIVRHTKGFSDTTTLKVLYCSLVRSVLEYNIQIWAPSSIGGMKLLESVQKRFLRYALPNLPWNEPQRLPPYDDRCGILKIEPIGSRVLLLRRVFIFDILSGNIDSTNLIEMIPFHVPSRALRNYEPLRHGPGFRTEQQAKMKGMQFFPSSNIFSSSPSSSSSSSLFHSLGSPTL
ncbi:uncharacterized protein LOC129750638 [Uranotaenia lowii]|uniref:uncharacterized protein LOC129750638 n=1 Tax=Uranotaenia lowii TaxID=190385 RepID=UPI00247AA88C|nr:uncharacterized protein LOC129750638 [Uranotaenia lowii]